MFSDSNGSACSKKPDVRFVNVSHSAGVGVSPAEAAAAKVAADLCHSEITINILHNFYDVFVFDCDGVLWHGNKVLPGIPEMLHKLQLMPKSNRSSGNKEVYFLSNNSTLSRNGFVQKLQRLGIDASEHQVLCTSYCTAQYILEERRRREKELRESSSSDDQQQKQQQQQQQHKSRVYVVGEQGLLDELRLHGIDAFGGSEEAHEEFDFSKDPEVFVEQNVGTVVVGLDRHFSYKKLQAAQLYINKFDADFIATNTDPLGNFSTKQKWAGAGAIVAAVAGACKKPPVIIGKPAEPMRNLLRRTIHEEDGEKHVLVIGDSLETDIPFAAAMGYPSCLCLTGVTGIHELQKSFAKLNKIRKDVEEDAQAYHAARCISPEFIIDTAANLVAKDEP